MPVPIRYSDVPTQALLQRNRMRDREQDILRRAELQNQKVLSSIPSAFARSLKTLDKDVANGMGLTALDDLTIFVNTPGVRVSDAAQLASKYLGKINATNSSIKSFRDGGERYIERMSEGMGLLKGVSRELLAQHIIANLDNPENLGDPVDYLTKAVKKDPELLTDATMGANAFMEAYKKLPTYQNAGGLSLNTTGMTTRSLDWASSQKTAYELVEEEDDKTGMVYMTPKLKKDAEGLVPQEVFDQLYNYKKSEIDFKSALYVDRGAKQMIKQENKGKSPTDKGYIDPDSDIMLDLYRKKYVTKFLEEMPPDKFALRPKVASAKPTAARGRGRGASAKAPAQPDYIQQVMSTIETGSAQDVSDILMRMSAGSGSVKVEQVKTHPTNKGFTINFRTKEGGKEVKRSKDFNPASPNFEAELTGFYQRATGSDTKTERRVMTQPKSTKKPQLTIKRADIAAKAKTAGYTTAEYESLLKQRNVKIID